MNELLDAVQKSATVVEHMIHNPTNSEEVRNNARNTLREIKEWEQEILDKLAKEAESGVVDYLGSQPLTPDIEEDVENNTSLDAERSGT